MSCLQGKGAMVVWLDIAHAARAEADDWYASEHLPDRVRAADYTRARRFRAVEGTPRYISLFEASTPEIMASERYFQLTRKVSEQSRRIRHAFGRTVRSTFGTEGSWSVADGGAWGSIRLNYADDGSRRALHAWFEGPLGAALRERPCIVGAHLLAGAPQVRARMDAERELGHQDEDVDAALFIEATQPEDIAALFGTLLTPADIAAAGGIARHEDYGIYQLMYSFEQQPR